MRRRPTITSLRSRDWFVLADWLRDHEGDDDRQVNGAVLGSLDLLPDGR